MGRRRRNRESSEAMPPLSARIDWLLRCNWGNNIAAMARDLGVSHTALSRVLTGQMPSAKMLEALAKRVEVNTLWLLTGQGQPQAETAGAVGGVFWPVVSQLLPGEPKDYPELLSHITLPAASPYVLDAAYWMRVNADAPIVAALSPKVASGDYLLIETSMRWTRRAEAYLGRLLVLRHEENDLLLAWSERQRNYFETVPQHKLDTFKVVNKARLFPSLTKLDARKKKPESMTGGPGLVQFYADDVVGVVLQRV